MGLVVGVFAFAVVLAVVAFAVLAAIAALVEILPSPGNRDTEDRSAKTAVAAPMHASQRLSIWHARKPRTFGH